MFFTQRRDAVILVESTKHSDDIIFLRNGVSTGKLFPQRTPGVACIVLNKAIRPKILTLNQPSFLLQKHINMRKTETDEFRRGGWKRNRANQWARHKSICLLKMSLSWKNLFDLWINFALNQIKRNSFILFRTPSRKQLKQNGEQRHVLKSWQQLLLYLGKL